MLPDKRQSKDNKHVYIGQIAFPFFHFFFPLQMLRGMGVLKWTPGISCLDQHSQGMKGTKANVKSIIPLFYTLLVEEAHWQEEVPFWSVAVVRTAHTPLKKPLKWLLASHPGVGAGGQRHFFLFYGFECVPPVCGTCWKTPSPLP